MKPIKLLWLVLLVALGWSAWWGWGAWRAERNLETWMEERRAAGWQAEWGDIEVAGYPTRIDRTITDLTLANTDGGWVWNAPFFQILGLNYQKDHFILVWPDRMSLQTPYERVAITGEDLRGSVTFVPETDMELDEATLVFKGLEFASDAGWTSSVSEARIATRPATTPEGSRDIGLEIVGLKPKSPVLRELSDLGMVPGTVDQLSADLAVRFDRPWDRSAIEAERPQPREIEIRNVYAKWGHLELRLAGDLSVARDGQLSGEVMVKATNWQEMLELAQQSGALPEALADTIASALRMLSRFAGKSDTLDIPVTLSDGRARIGILPIGRAPVIRLP